MATFEERARGAHTAQVHAAEAALLAYVNSADSFQVQSERTNWGSLGDDVERGLRRISM